MRRRSGMARKRSTLALAGALALLAGALTSTSVAKTTDPPRVVEPEASASEGHPDRAVIVVVLDGARWQDVVGDGHAMPRLTALAREHGAVVGAPKSGTTLRASGPNFVSMPGYAEIFGGAPARECTGNDECASATHETIADAVRADSGSPYDAAVFASWPDLVRVSSTNPDALVVSAGRSLTHHEALMRNDPEMSELLDRGERADAWPGEKDFRPDRFTAPIAERYLALFHPRFLFVSLGESDEYAHQGNRLGYLDALHYADGVIAELYAATHGPNAHGRATTLLVTADHGRSNDFRDHGERWPESSRSWLVALGDDVSRGALRGAGDRALADLAPTVRAWLGLPADDASDSGHAIAGLLE
jgi:hypothetical protein